jgi:hypothetical protein
MQHQRRALTDPIVFLGAQASIELRVKYIGRKRLVDPHVKMISTWKLLPLISEATFNSNFLND